MPKSKQLFYFLCLIILFISGTLPADENYLAARVQLKPYLLPKDRPLSKQLADLFHDPAMFQSPRYLREAGFNVKPGNPKTGLMVIGHSSIPHYLLKKFPDRVSQSLQLKNFVKRIKGAKLLRHIIKKHHFKHLVVPKKWLYKLPKKFSSHSYVLVVEKMDIYDDWDNPNGEARKLYYNMDKEVLTELCILLHEAKGNDSFPRNMPFTRSGQIAFIDTEHVGVTKRKGQFYRDMIPTLNPELQTYAIALWEMLEEEARKRK